MAEKNTIKCDIQVQEIVYQSKETGISLHTVSTKLKVEIPLPAPAAAAVDHPAIKLIPKKSKSCELSQSAELKSADPKSAVDENITRWCCSIIDMMKHLSETSPDKMKEGGGSKSRSGGTSGGSGRSSSGSGGSRRSGSGSGGSGRSGSGSGGSGRSGSGGSRRSGSSGRSGGNSSSSGSGGNGSGGKSGRSGNGSGGKSSGRSGSGKTSGSG